MRRHPFAPPLRDPEARQRFPLQRFRELVSEALDSLPKGILPYLENVAVVVEDEPSDEILLEMGLDPEHDTLFGLYTGTPVDQRGASHNALPDHIAIYYLPLTDEYADEYHLRREIRRTVVHEVGHHFGFSDQRLREMGY
ncbi:metallopeptidase family protein [Candidatus Binatia bacterium]|nr:metallopeptidase family protein [Candidatus Binatia bacterium]